MKRGKFKAVFVLLIALFSAFSGVHASALGHFAASATSPSFTGQLSGNRLVVDYSPAGNDLGKQGQLFVSIVVPPSDVFYSSDGISWVEFKGNAASIPAFFTGSLASQTIVAVNDISTLPFGTKIYVGYGVAGVLSPAGTALNSELNNATYDVVYTTNATVSTAVLTGLTVNCPASVSSAFGGICTATGVYGNGISQDVTQSVSWYSSNTSVLNFMKSGEFTSYATAVDTPVSITAIYNENGKGLSAYTTVTVTMPATLTALSASCPSTIKSGASSSCGATASYSDGSSKAVPASWNSSNTAALFIGSGGNLTAGAPAVDTAVTISASYTENGVTKSAVSQSVTVKTAAIALTGLTATCPATLTAGGGGACSAAASYSDGSSKAVTPASWTSSSSDILAVSGSGSGGQLTANKPGVAKICASFSENGATLSQCADVTVSAPAALVLPAPLIVVAGENQSIAPTSGKAVYCYASSDTLTVSLDKNTNTIALSAAGAASGKALLTCVDSGGISAKADVTLYPEGTLQISAPSPMETGDSRDIAIIGTPTACTAGIPGIVSTAPRQNGLKLQALKPGKTDLTCINARSRSSVVPITVNTKYPLQDAKLAHAGALVNDVARMENPLTLTVRDNASLQLALNVPAEHQNKAVEPLLVVVLGKETFVTRTGGGSWSGWDKSPATLPAAGKKLLAGNQLTFNDIYEGVLPAGEYTVFAGYRYDDGSGIVPIVVNLTAPLRIVVKPN